MEVPLRLVKLLKTLIPVLVSQPIFSESICIDLQSVSPQLASMRGPGYWPLITMPGRSKPSGAMFVLVMTKVY